MQKLVYICDECGEEFECTPGLGFKEAWEEAKDDEWIAYKDPTDGEWKHKCPECR